jgi:hypothetical protein
VEVCYGIFRQAFFGALHYAAALWKETVQVPGLRVYFPAGIDLPLLEMPQVRQLQGYGRKPVKALEYPGAVFTAPGFSQAAWQETFWVN